MISEFCIKRPVFATVLSLLIIVFGIASLLRLPIRELPDVDAAVVSVTTGYTGAAPEIVDSDITETIEGVIAGIAGIKNIASYSRRGRGRTVIEFEPGRKIDEAANDVRDAVARIRSKLPEDADERQKEIERIRPFDWEENFPLIFEAGGFDAVIGNPPYIDSETMVTYQKTERDYISRIFRTAQGNWDIYIPFWELSFKSVKKECRASLITPNKWISIGYGKALREYLFNYIEQTCDCSGIKVFLDAGNNPIIVTIVKNTGVQSIARLKYREEYNLRALSPIAKNELTGIEWGILLSEHGKIVLKVRGIPSKISDFFLVENPFTTSEAYKIKEILEDGCYNEKNHFKFTNTGTIDPYITLWGLKKTTYIKDRYNRPVVNKTKFRNLLSKRFKQTQQKKIIITGMRYFESFLDFKGEFIAGKSTIIVCDKPNHDELAMLLPILNSKLLSFYINESFSALGIDGGVNFSKKLVSNLPLPKIRTVIKGKLIKLGEEETALNKRLHKEKSPSRIKSIEGQIAHTDKVIDKLVYELYDLTEEEIGIVEGE